MLDRLESRARESYEALRSMARGETPPGDIELLTKGEAESVEAAIGDLAERLLGEVPPESLWDSIHAYAQRNYTHKDEYAENEAEYFRWYLMGIRRTHVFLDYLEGFSEASDDLEPAKGERPPTKSSDLRDSGLRSVFISYGGPDVRFATMLNDGLRRAGVATFFFPDDAPPGAKLHRVMREGVNSHDHVILICSRSSLDRSGVANELEEALQRESREGGKTILIPVAIDDYVFSEWAPANAGTAQAIRDRVVADFREAPRNPVAFERALGRVVAVLSKGES